MDIRMPNLDGLEATRRLLAGNEAPTRVLILTTFELNEYVYEALRAGASGFLIKDAPAEQLIDAVRIGSAGDALLSPSVTRRVIEEFARLARAEPRPAPGTRGPHHALQAVVFAYEIGLVQAPRFRARADASFARRLGRPARSARAGLTTALRRNRRSPAGARCAARCPLGRI
jgi:CheY-like chemotaxis protein